jgi:hypothetical protein
MAHGYRPQPPTEGHGYLPQLPTKTTAPGPRTKAAGVTKKAAATAAAKKDKTKAAAAAAKKGKNGKAAPTKKKAVGAKKAAPVKKAAPKPTTKGTAKGVSGSGAGAHSSASSSHSSSSRSSSVSSTREPPAMCGGNETEEVFAARDAEHAARVAAAKTKIAKQQSASKTKLSAADVKKAVEREAWMAEKKEMRAKNRADAVLARQEDAAYARLRARVQRIQGSGREATREETNEIKEIERAIARGPAVVLAYSENMEAQAEGLTEWREAAEGEALRDFVKDVLNHIRSQGREPTAAEKRVFKGAKKAVAGGSAVMKAYAERNRKWREGLMMGWGAEEMERQKVEVERQRKAIEKGGGKWAGKAAAAAAAAAAGVGKKTKKASPKKPSPKKPSPKKKASAKDEGEETEDKEEDEEEDSYGRIVCTFIDGPDDEDTVGYAVGQGVDTVLSAGAKILSGQAPWTSGRAKVSSDGLLALRGEGEGNAFANAACSLRAPRRNSRSNGPGARVLSSKPG